jgi:hypothetical protein
MNNTFINFYEERIKRRRIIGVVLIWVFIILLAILTIIIGLIYGLNNNSLHIVSFSESFSTKFSSSVTSSSIATSMICSSIFSSVSNPNTQFLGTNNAFTVFFATSRLYQQSLVITGPWTTLVDPYNSNICFICMNASAQTYDFLEDYVRGTVCSCFYNLVPSSSSLDSFPNLTIYTGGNSDKFTSETTHFIAKFNFVVLQPILSSNINPILPVAQSFTVQYQDVAVQTIPFGFTLPCSSNDYISIAQLNSNTSEYFIYGSIVSEQSNSVIINIINPPLLPTYQVSIIVAPTNYLNPSSTSLILSDLFTATFSTSNDYIVYDLDPSLSNTPATYFAQFTNLSGSPAIESVVISSHNQLYIYYSVNTSGTYSIAIMGFYNPNGNEYVVNI